MRFISIEQTDIYRLDTINGGAAFEFTHKPTGETKFIQYGDDAESFAGMYQAIQNCYCDPASVWYAKTWDECLGELWHHA